MDLVMIMMNRFKFIKKLNDKNKQKYMYIAYEHISFICSSTFHESICIYLNFMIHIIMLVGGVIQHHKY